MSKVLLILATWGLTLVFQNEDGPFDIFKRFRSYIGIREDEFVDPYGEVGYEQTGDTFLAKLILCPVCFSAWISAILVGLSLVPRGKNLITWLGVWGGAILLFRKG